MHNNAHSLPSDALNDTSPAIYDVALFESIHQVDPRSWDSLVQARSPFLQRRYLACIESGAHDQVSSRYALFTQGQRPMGAAVFQVTDFVRSRPEKELSKVREALPLTKRLLLAAQPSRLPLVVCGSSFHAGEHGFAFVQDASPASAADSLVRAAELVQRERTGSGKPAGTLFKEFVEQGPIRDRLTNHAFHALETDPVMVLGVDPNWKSFSDYLASLTSKYRVKARRAYDKSSALFEKTLEASEIDRLRPELQRLHDAVLDRADYRLARLDMGTLGQLRCGLGDVFFVKGYFLEDRLAGFMTGFHVGSMLEAHLVGIDYELNHDHSTYSRMLYDYLRIAIERGASSVNYGRTATEIKSTLGAVPVDMTCYVRHRSPTLNKLLPLAVRAIRPPGLSLRKPFKREWYEMHGDGLLSASSLLSPAMG